MSSRDDLCAGLRSLADFLEQNPTFPVPNVATNTFVSNKEEFQAACRTLGVVKKLWGGIFLTVRRYFGPIPLDVDIYREKVCKRVVKGQKWIPSRDGFYEEDVEWVCDDPILAEKTTP